MAAAPTVVRLGAALAAAALALTGCAATNPAKDHPRRPSAAPSDPDPGGRRVIVGAGDNGRTVAVTVGDVVSLRLASTYWQVAPATPAAVLRTDSRATLPSGPARSCVPGQGCGFAVAGFTAVAPGRATISASRTTCGEALRCSPARSRYRLTVLVRRR
jgi:hypothetical protein